MAKKISFRYLIIGSNGLLGSKIKKNLPSKKTFCIARSFSDYNCDLLNLKKILDLFNKYEFSNVINCAALANIDKCEKNKIKCRKINLDFPIFLNSLSKKKKFNLIHISTDQVYCKGNKKKYKETDKISFTNFYSKTKYLAEKHLIKNDKCLIIRTNFTGFKKNLKETFIGWILESLINKKKIKLYNDLYVSTLDVNYCSKIIIKLINLNAKGVFNLGSNSSLSKEKFAFIFAKKLKKKLYYESVSSKRTSIFRPQNLTMDTKKIEKKVKINMPSPRKVINNLINETIIYENFRN
tara:strand:- start:1474 stop:2358 length:885 start_codon:yes stop_codon:yes gene_type:complete